MPLLIVMDFDFCVCFIHELCPHGSRSQHALIICLFQKHLSDVEFERHLGTTRDEFYRLPEFKRNDIKKKVLIQQGIFMRFV